MLVPSTIAMKLASSPSRNSSTTTTLAGLAEAATEHVLRRGDGFVLRRADHDALAGGEAVRLHDEWRLLRSESTPRRTFRA